MAVPQGTGPAVSGIDVLHLAPTQRDDDSGNGFRPLWCNQQMDMVRHEGVGERRALFFYERLAQPVKVGLVVFFAEEAGFAVMPALHDVQRNIIKMDARAAGHAPIIENLFEPGSFYRLMPPSNFEVADRKSVV